MGVDPRIYVKTSDGEIPRTEIPLRFLCFEQEPYEDDYLRPTGATHAAYQANAWRYCTGRTRYWPEVAESLMLLLTAPNVAQVWYFGDDEDTGDDPENVCTLERVQEYTKKYMENYGADPMRPYREKWAEMLGIPEFPIVKT